VLLPDVVIFHLMAAQTKIISLAHAPVNNAKDIQCSAVVKRWSTSDLGGGK
jgi:hypothetical protein